MARKQLGKAASNSTDLTTRADVVALVSTTPPGMDGTASAGSSGKLADAGHLHPTDTSRAPVASPTFTGSATSSQFIGTGNNGGGGSAFLARGAGSCAFGMINTSAASDTGKWDVLVGNTFLYGRALNDAESNFNNWIAVNRSSYSITSIALGGPTTAPVISASNSFNLPSYTVSTLPAAGTAGRVVHCSNARMQTSTAGTLETSGSGTGGTVTDNGSAWKIAGTNITVSA